MLRLPEGGAVLIYGGRPEKGPRVASLLRQMGIDRLDVLLITHFHPDHAGGLGPVFDQLLPFSSKKERTGIILLPLFPKAVEPEVETVLRKIERRPYRVVRRGEIIPLSPSVRLEVLHPEALRGNPNEDSLVVKVIHREIVLLFMADIGRRGAAGASGGLWPQVKGRCGQNSASWGRVDRALHSGDSSGAGDFKRRPESIWFA